MENKAAKARPLIYQRNKNLELELQPQKCGLKNQKLLVKLTKEWEDL